MEITKNYHKAIRASWYNHELAYRQEYEKSKNKKICIYYTILNAHFFKGKWKIVDKKLTEDHLNEKFSTRCY